MIKAHQLKPGQTITTVSLSSGMAGDAQFLPRYHYGISRVEALFQCRVTPSPHSLKGSTFVYENPKLRAQDLMEAFRNPEVNAIFSNIGGDDAIRMLPYIDFDVIRDNPKIVLGYSDTTIVHWMCYKAGLVSFYGPSIMAEFAENVAMHDYTVTHLKKALCLAEPMGKVSPSPVWTNEFLEWSNPENLNRERTLKPNSGYEWLQGSGKHQGALLGGCLEVLEFMKGTILWPCLEEWRGKILFFETSEDQPTPTQLLYFLRNYAAAGIFGVVSGLLFGKPQDEKYLDEYRAVIIQVICKEYGYSELPIVYNMNFGHNAPMCVLPLGVMAEIDCEAKTFSIIEAAVL